MVAGQKITDPDVARVYDTFSPPVKKALLQLRRMILSVARETDGVGELEETLKWGQPSYLTSTSKSGSTIRIGREKKTDGDFAMFFKCQTTLVSEFRARFSGVFRFEGNRAIVFRLGEDIPVEELRQCIAMALTYHLNKRPAPAPSTERRRSR